MANAPTAFLLRRFHGDEQNRLVQRWCDETFMADRESPWPLVLYGPSGTGKSALAETLACRSKLNCKRLTADDFRRQFLTAIATKSVPTLRARLREPEMLLLDELVLSAEEPAVVRELVQLLDFYSLNQRPVIVTTIQMPELSGTLAGLRSRLSAGLVIEVKRPGVAARREIASELLKRFDLKMLDEDLDWWARSLPETAPLIRSYISRIALESNDPLLSRAMIKSSSGDSTDCPDPQQVRELVKLVGRQFGIRVAEMTGRSRSKEVVRARSVAMYLTRELLNATYRQIGQFIGGRDPSTVRHACSQIKKQLVADPSMADSVLEVTAGCQRYLERSGGKTCSFSDQSCAQVP